MNGASRWLDAAAGMAMNPVSTLAAKAAPSICLVIQAGMIVSWKNEWIEKNRNYVGLYERRLQLDSLKFEMFARIERAAGDWSSIGRSCRSDYCRRIGHSIQQ